MFTVGGAAFTVGGATQNCVMDLMGPKYEMNDNFDKILVLTMKDE